MTAADIEIAAPPELPPSPSSGTLLRLLPVVLSVATLSVMAAGFFSGSVRNPMFMAFPVMMLGSVVASALTARGGHREIDGDRVDYLAYLSGLRLSIAEIAAAQRSSLSREHPEPDMLWTLIGGPEMWRRRHVDPNFCQVRWPSA